MIYITDFVKSINYLQSEFNFHVVIISCTSSTKRIRAESTLESTINILFILLES